MNKINIVGSDDDIVILETICPFCKKPHRITVNYSEYAKGVTKYKDYGALIQDAFPNFTPSQREFLMTGICDSCWDKM